MNWFDQIEKYHLGLLANDEKERFEAAMAADEQLADAVRLQRIEWEAQELLAENLLRAEIRKQFTGYTPTTPSEEATRPQWRFFNWKYFLPVIVIACLAVYFFVSRNSGPGAPATSPQQQQATPPIQNQPAQQDMAQKLPDPPKETLPNQPAAFRKLALNAYQPPAGLSGIRGATDEDLLNRAAQAFAGKQYLNTIRLLDTLPEDGAQEALSLRAHARFNARQFDAAAADFSALEAGGIYRREAQWFGLLARMAGPKADKASLKRELEAISRDKNHPYGKAAAQLIKLFQ